MSLPAVNLEDDPIRRPVDVEIDTIGRCRMRPLIAEDRDRISRAYVLLSEKSRLNRFWTRQETMSDSMAQRLSHTDGVNHSAWVILHPTDPDFPGLGAGSWWRDRRNPELAEVAFTIGDPWQGKGLGTIIMAQLWIEAWARGIREFEGIARIGNTDAINWWRGLGGTTWFDGMQQQLRLTLQDPVEITDPSKRVSQWIQALREPRPRS